ncbi:hypothetical protein QFZ73_005357 [Peribacillus sp. V2I11]|nr:hypothetical protein [Peribacillus sp. V2I11]
MRQDRFASFQTETFDADSALPSALHVQLIHVSMDCNLYRSFRLLSSILTTAAPRVASDKINAFTTFGIRLVESREIAEPIECPSRYTDCRLNFHGILSIYLQTEKNPEILLLDQNFHHTLVHPYAITLNSSFI